MARSATWLLAAVTATSVALAGWIYLDNRALRSELAALKQAQARPEAARPDAGDAAGPRERRGERGGLAALARAFSGPRREPADADRAGSGSGSGSGSGESRAERRARREAEMASMFGRSDGETEAEYRERMVPFISGMLEKPRQRALEQRREAEAKAGVTPEQSAAIDTALAATYGELIEYTDAAVAEGQLSPYQRNVSGWLGYAGGLGGILSGTESKLGSILRPEQTRAMYDAGFEWSEFLGVSAPWEKLRPPPPPKPAP